MQSTVASPAQSYLEDKTRLKTSSRTLFSEKSKIHLYWKLLIVLGSWLLKKKKNHKKNAHTQKKTCRPNSRIYCCLMYNFYFYIKAAVMCMKSKPPSTLFRQSCRWDPRLLPTELLPSFPPPTLYSSQNIYFFI